MSKSTNLKLLAESFRVYPSTGQHFFEVMVFPGVRSMRKYGRAREALEGRPDNSGVFDALFLPEECNDPKLPREMLGQILFSKTTITEGIVAHEFAHAAMHYCRWRKLDPGNDEIQCRGQSHEEVCTTALQKLVDEFYSKSPRED